MGSSPVLRGGALQKSIIDLAHLYGWRVAHFSAVKDSRGVWRTPVKADGKGFPDLILVRDRLIAAEIKGDGDRLRPDQEEWISALKNAGVETYVWKPADWRSGEIDLILRVAERDKI